MKKVICCFLLFALLLAGCSNAENVPKIDEYGWDLKTVQGADGNVVFYAPGKSDVDIYTDAEELELTCKAENGALTITDTTNDKTYTGTYTVSKTSPEAIIYDITIGDAQGHAVTGATTYKDGNIEPTFIISINDYAINFVA